MLGPAGGGGACDYESGKEEKEGDDWARGARDSPNLRTRGTDGRHAFFRVGTDVVVNGGYKVQSTRLRTVQVARGSRQECGGTSTYIARVLGRVRTGLGRENNKRVNRGTEIFGM